MKVAVVWFRSYMCTVGIEPATVFKYVHYKMLLFNFPYENSSFLYFHYLLKIVSSEN
jgi:hypothetical protein